MTDELDYSNNPLHGVGLKSMLTELVDHYGFDILYAYLNINCFKTNPSIASSAKFLKKTDWAREKVEVFYLYQFKNLPKVSSEQFALPPRERIVPPHQKPREPAELSLEDAAIVNEKRAKKAADRDQNTGARRGSSRAYNEQRNAGFNKSPRKSDPWWDDKKSSSGSRKAADPWGNWKGGKESSDDADESATTKTNVDPCGSRKESKASSNDESDSAETKAKVDPWGNQKADKVSSNDESDSTETKTKVDPWANWKDK